MLIDKLLNRLEYHFIVFRNSNVLPNPNTHSDTEPQFELKLSMLGGY